MHCKIFLLIGIIVFTTSCTTEQKISLKIKNDPQTNISFTYPAEWQETLTYSAIKINNLSEEKNIPVWEDEPISAQEEAKREQALLKKPNLILPLEDPIAGEIQREIILLDKKIPALIKTHFGKTNVAERWLRFYKDDWQITITKTLPITKEGKTTKILQNLSTEIVKEAAQKILTDFETMVQTINFY